MAGQITQEGDYSKRPAGEGQHTEHNKDQAENTPRRFIRGRLLRGFDRSRDDWLQGSPFRISDDEKDDEKHDRRDEADNLANQIMHFGIERRKKHRRKR